MRRFSIALATLVAAFAAGPAPAQDKPTLTVMTYSSFAGKYGPGPKLKDRPPRPPVSSRCRW